jgi:hypothetical protein
MNGSAADAVTIGTVLDAQRQRHRDGRHGQHGSAAHRTVGTTATSMPDERRTA